VAAAQDSGCGRITAIVLDDQAKPVEGANLKLRFAADETVVLERELTTDKKGKCSYLGLKGGSWLLRVEAIGFEPWEEPIEIFSQGIAEPVHVNLVRLPDEVVRAQRMAAAADLYDCRHAGRRATMRRRAPGTRRCSSSRPDQLPVLVSLAKTCADEALEEAAAVLSARHRSRPRGYSVRCARWSPPRQMAEAEAARSRPTSRST
jgi:hypothetical protein